MFEDVRDTVAGAEPAPGPDAAPENPPAPEDAIAPEAGASAPGPVVGETPPAAPEPDYKDRWLRAEAEMQNVRRRAAREREEGIARAEERVLLDVIDVLDDLERALAALSTEQANEAWAKGVALTAQRMRDTLARHGVVAVESVGRPFDPNVHDALLEIPAPEGVAPGSVAQETTRGYRRGERVLRPAKVVVARADGGA